MQKLTKISVSRIGALLCSAALAATVLTACGGDSPTEGDPMSAQPTPVSTQSLPEEPAEEPAEESGEEPAESADEPAESEGSSRDGLPEGYPDDVPLPDFTAAHKTGGGLDVGFWVVVLELSDATDTPVEDYAAQLEAAGYTVEDGTGGKEATNGTWDVSFHSALQQTLTVSVIGA